MTGALLALRRFVALAWDNPTAEHDARTILTPGKVGLWLGLEVALVLLSSALIQFVALPDSQELRRFVAEVGAGQVHAANVFGTVCAFLTLVVPLRASWLLEGPRRRGYLDQIVTTGISPLRYYAGKWASSQPFFVALLAATLPPIVLFTLLGGADPWRALVSYVLLFAFANLVLVVTLALGTVLHEVVALLLSWGLFFAASGAAFAPIPSVLGALSPQRYFVQPFVDALAGAEAAMIGPLYGAARPFGAVLPWPTYTLAMWAALGGVALLTCALGPLHSFVPGLNNFGAVVIPGDAGRLRVRRLRPFLSRRVELAFLFENAGPRLLRWALPLRTLQQVSLLALVAFVLQALAFDPFLTGQAPLPFQVGVQATAAGLVLLLSLLVFASGRVDALRSFRLGRFAIPQVAFDVGGFLLVLGVVLALQRLGYLVAWEAMVANPSRAWSPLAPEDASALSDQLLALLIVVAGSTFLALKVAGSELLGRGPALLAGGLYLLVMNLVPLVCLSVAYSCSQADDPLVAQTAPTWFVLAEAAPGVALNVIVEGVPRAFRAHHWLLERGFWLWHAGLIGTLVVAAWAGHATVAREARAMRPAAPDGELSCPRCRSRRSIEPVWTAWGGLIGTRLVHPRRCVDCHHLFGPHGRDLGRVPILVALLARGLIAGGLVAIAVLTIYQVLLP